MQWKLAGSTDTLGTEVAYPTDARELRVDIYLKHTAISSLVSFSNTFVPSLEGWGQLYKMCGYYFSDSYYACMGLKLTSSAISMSSQAEWTSANYGGTTSINWARMKVYYR